MSNPTDPTRTPENPSPEQGNNADDPASVIASIPAMAEMHVKIGRENFEFDFDYSPESLVALDQIISTCWEEPPVFVDQVVMTMGAYTGETIRKNLGGSWAYEDQMAYHLADVGGVGVRVSPFGKGPSAL
jgi:hypothetical protein